MTIASNEVISSERGKEKCLEVIIINMFNAGMTLEEIAEHMGLTHGEILLIKANA